MTPPLKKHPEHEHLLGQLRKVITVMPFNQILGVKPIKLDLEGIAMSFDMRQELVGNFLQNILHGGVISSVLDMAGGVAVMVTTIFKYPEHSVEEMSKMLAKSSTIDLQVSFLRPGRGQHFIAKAFVTHSGNKISFARMDLYDQDELIIATGSATYFVK